MIHWKTVEAGDWKVYTKKLLDIFNSDKEGLVFNRINPFWNSVIDNRAIQKMVPELSELVSLYGEFNEIAMLVINSDYIGPHIDHTTLKNKGVVARLNVPVLNCEKSITAWYDMPKELPYKELPGGTRFWEKSLRTELTPVTKITLSGPTILRTNYPHAVICEECTFPRISLSMSFKIDLQKYLK